MSLEEILFESEAAMEKAVGYLKNELRGVRTGRASTALVEYLKVDCYGAEAELRSLAVINVPEASSILIKPFDPGTIKDVARAIEKAGLGLNPIVEGKQVRLNIPPLSGERRQQLVGSVKQMGEQTKVAIRNVRRDAKKHIDQAVKDKSQHLSEDDGSGAHDEVQRLLKNYEKQVDEIVAQKTKEVQEI